MKTPSHLKTMGFAVLAIASSLSTGCVTLKGDTHEEKTASAVKVRDEQLAKLYEARPEAQEVIESSPGYLFSSGFGMHPGLFTFAVGWGVVRNNATGEDSYMRYWRVGLGPGIAVKGNFSFLVADSEEGLKRLRETNWLSSLYAEASLKFGSFGGGWTGATSPRGVKAKYVWTHTGFALEGMWLFARHKQKDEL